ncbi:MAG: hypothetical protein ABMA64_36110 [Myxococcota bacterium]
MWIAITAAWADDLNCNGLDASVEQPVDLSDPLCASHIDPATGNPYETADRYHDYARFGCTFLLDDAYDIDGDGVGMGLVRSAGLEVALTCDNCPSDANADQLDTDGDGVGDVCVDGLYLGWPSPGHTGQPNDLVVMSSSAGSTVKVAVSTTLGAWAVPGCGGVELGLQAPVKFDGATASVLGAAVATRNVPVAFAGSILYFQAYEVGTCRVSNLVEWQY